MRVPFHSSSALPGALALALLLSAPAAFAGQGKQQAPAPRPAPAPARPGGNQARGNRAGAPRQVPAEQLEKLLNMGPEERQKALSKLPPPQQKQLQNRLDNLDRQSPAQRQQNLDRLRQLEKLPPARQQAVTKQIQSMNQLSFADQREILNQPEFTRNFSPEEQQIVRERFPQAASNVARPIDKLLPARRQAVNKQIQSMNQLSFADQREILNQPEFARNFSPEEQQIVRERFPQAASNVARPIDKLLPARRQAVNKQIQSMNQLSFADQREILNQPEFARNFSPEEQQIVRERFPQAASNAARPIDKLLPARRQAVNKEMQRISQLPVPERRQALHSPEFNQNFSPEEQQILRDRFPNAAK